MDGRSTGSAGLAEPRVSLERVAEMRAVRRMKTLILGDILLKSKRNAVRKLRQGRIGRHASCPESGGIESILSKRFQQQAELFLLSLLDGISGIESGKGHQNVLALRLRWRGSIGISVKEMVRRDFNQAGDLRRYRDSGHFATGFVA